MFDTDFDPLKQNVNIGQNIQIDIVEINQKMDMIIVHNIFIYIKNIFKFL